MRLIHEQPGARLYNGDALELGTEHRASVFIIDPPYSRAGAIHTGRSTANGTQMDAAGSDQFWLYWFRDVVRRMAGVLDPAGHGFVFTDYRTIALVEKAFAATGTWQVTQSLVWDRDSMGLGSPFRASHELIAFCRGPQFKWGGRKDLRNVLRFQWHYGEHDHHPAEKPTALLRYLIEQTTQPVDAVLDCFCGSGSTLVAAAECGRSAIGVELDEDHCATTIRRLQQSTLAIGGAA